MSAGDNVKNATAKAKARAMMAVGPDAMFACTAFEIIGARARTLVDGS